MRKTRRLVEARKLVSILMMLMMMVGFLTLVPTMAYAADGGGVGEPAAVAAGAAETCAHFQEG